MLAGALLLQGGVNDLAQFGYKGKVKTATERRYVAVREGNEWHAGQPDKGAYQEYQFDEHGYYNQQNIFDSSGTLIARTIPNRRTNLVMTATVYDNEMRAQSQMDYFYEKKDTVFIRTHDRDGVLIFETQEVYGENGRLKSMTRVDFTMRVPQRMRTVMIYDQDGQVSEIRNIDVRGKVVKKTTFQYLDKDVQGNWTKALRYVENAETPECMVVREITYW